MSASNGTPPYTVEYPQRLLDKLMRYAAIASERGILNEYTAALRFVHDRLARDPKEWGDPLKNWPGARLSGFRGKHELLVVFYAVHDEQPIVFVREILILPPLDPDHPPF